MGCSALRRPRWLRPEHSALQLPHPPPSRSAEAVCPGFQCNNPMTKEPKLEAAVRIVPEWQDYDQEVKQLQIRFQEEKAAARGPGPAQEPLADGRPAASGACLPESSGPGGAGSRRGASVRRRPCSSLPPSAQPAHRSAHPAIAAFFFC